ncbi:MAG: hypothetical protein U1C73_18550 [Dietzia sp.]|nr:hypothetical protein [Dietzia sp.]
MTTRRYAHESHVVFPETNGARPTREELLAEQALEERRRDRAARARQQIRRPHHGH